MSNEYLILAESVVTAVEAQQRALEAMTEAVRVMADAIRAQPAPVVNVAAAEVNVPPTVVNVAPSDVVLPKAVTQDIRIVSMPSSAQKVTRDQMGRITRITEE